MADQQLSEPTKWVFVAAFGVLIRELLGRLRRAPRPSGYLTKDQVQAMIDDHAAATAPIRGIASLSARMGQLEDRADTMDVKLDEVLRRLDHRTAGD